MERSRKSYPEKKVKLMTTPRKRTCYTQRWLTYILGTLALLFSVRLYWELVKLIMVSFK